MKFHTFGGFFSESHTQAGYGEQVRAFRKNLSERFPLFVKGATFTDEGMDTEDAEFHAALKQHEEGLIDLRARSFCGQGLNKLGVVLNIRATPGSSLYGKYGDTIRVHVLGGSLREGEADTEKRSVLAGDDIVVSYLDLTELLEFPD